MRAPFLACAALAALSAAQPAAAFFITVDHVNVDECDDLLVPQLVDELGDAAVFPLDEGIAAKDLFTDLIACPGSFQNFGVPNTLVEITNLTNNAFGELWYVADPETRFSNVDGLVNGEEAFKIDTVGLNQPLVFESGAADGVFSPGETWQFIVDNYSNSLGLPASSLASVGAVGALSVGDQSSAASIISTRVPEPAAAAFALACCSLIASRRRRGR